MKSLIALAITTLALTGCSSIHPAVTKDSETVMVTHHVQVGKEEEFEQLLAHGWEVYRSEQMVFAEPHTVVRKTDDGKISFVEIFTWIEAPDHAPDTVKAVWSQEHALTEQRNGKGSIEFS